MIKFYILISFIFLKTINCFYFYFDKNAGVNQRLKRLALNVSSVINEGFPETFFLNVSTSNINLAFKLLPNYPKSNVYLYSQNKDRKKEFNKELEYRHYVEIEGRGSGTLVRYINLKNQGDNSEVDYRFILTIFSSNGTQFDIYPAIFNKDTSTLEFSHIIEKTTPTLFDYDETKIKNYVKNEDENKRRRRSLNGQPLNLYVEYLVVLDSSVYLKYKNIFNQLDDDLILQYLRIHYSHLVHAIDLRYQNTLGNDPDLRINIRFANLLVYTNPQDTPWTNNTLVGSKDYPLYNGKETLYMNSSVSLFASTMKSRTFSFSYDHAVSFVDKDLWSSSVSDPAIASSPNGYAFNGGICSNFKYSIIEDNSFKSIDTAAHELGHNLGAVHDGTSSAINCPASDNYLMTAVSGFYTNNLQNVYKFSSCSVEAFKNLLISNDGNITLNSRCLLNVPIQSDLYIDFSVLTGTLYSADQQCQLIFGNLSTHSKCSYTGDNICETLQCSDNDDENLCIYSDGWGALDGTPCDTGKVCYLGNCVYPSSISGYSTNTFNCSSNPCLNGGTCIPINLFYLCKCHQNYTGLNCETSLLSSESSSTSTTTTTTSESSSTSTTTTTTTSESSSISTTTTTTTKLSSSTTFTELINTSTKTEVTTSKSPTTRRRTTKRRRRCPDSSTVSQ